MFTRIAGCKRHSAVNGPGIRYVLFFQGCPHHCSGCQNPETWDPDGGQKTDTENIIRDLESTKYLDGITLSGGDPLLQPLAAGEIADAAHKKGLDVWCYTGWTFEELMEGKAGPDARAVLSRIDVLADGPFELPLLSQDVIYRGSSNQRLIMLKETFALGRIVLYQP